MVEVRRALLLLTLTGCNEVYGLDPTTVRDLEPPACSTVQFGVPVQLEEFRDGATEYDAQLSADGNELWFTMDTVLPDMERRNLMYRTVRGADGTFATPATLLDLVDMNERHTGDPAMTADGKRVIFRVDTTPSTLYEGIREDANQIPFETIVPVLGFSTVPGGVRSFDLTWDGLRLYFTNNDGELSMGSRPSRDQPFGSFVPLGTDYEYPTISGDELEIFYRHWDDPDIEPTDTRMFRRARASRSDPFGPEQLILDDGSDPDIAPTSSQLIVSVDAGLAIMKRRCEED
jgi:hypothetical protein